ncbi:pituitary tumor-transforming gene 1 protein-interacting protein-like [Porites lutea]|uniref:pituitary tumor-transforming gene 1 protein-interacting protein-like n=1 Tax=Porites lutea TaxID=51062 RepID=UPI003CC51E9B
MFFPRYSTILAFLTILYSVQLWHRCVVADKCTNYSGESCKNCVDQPGCAYCEKNKACMDFDLVKDTLNKACEGQEWKFKQCLVSGKILLIALPVTGFVVLVALICFVYCCCCRRKRNSSKDEKEDAKLRKQRKELRERHKEREKERREKRDEIRKKYGLTTA